MKNVVMMVENLEKASDGVSMARDDLLAALKNADRVQALLIHDLSVRATDLINDIDRLLNAVKSED